MEAGQLAATEGRLPYPNGFGWPRSRPKGREQKVAVLIDLANAEGVDFRQLIARVHELGHVEVLRAYGDFRQRHLDPTAIELYLLGVEMVHCPSWPNGGLNGDGTARRKRTDDRLLEQGAHDLARRRPSITTYVVVTADADIIPTCHSLSQQGKEIVLVCPVGDAHVGHVLQHSNFMMERAAMLSDLQEGRATIPGDVQRPNGQGLDGTPGGGAAR